MTLPRAAARRRAVHVHRPLGARAPPDARGRGTTGRFTGENRRGRTSHEHPPLLFAGDRRVRRVDGLGVGRPRRVERQPHDARRAAARRAAGDPGRRAAAPRRGRARAGRVVPHARGRRRPQRSRSDGRHPAVPSLTCGRAPSHPATPRPVLRQHVGSGLLRSRPDDPAGARRPRRRRSGSSGSCSTTGGSGHGATTRRGSATGSSRPRRTRRARAADRPRQVARDGVRYLGRTGDGQPGQRPVPRPPRVGARDRRLRARARPQPARARPRPARRVRARARPTRRPARATTTSPTSSGT